MKKNTKAKDKAKEIYFAFLNIGKGLISEHLAKQNAKECVEQILESHTYVGSGVKAYWRNVRLEISKLNVKQ